MKKKVAIIGAGPSGVYCAIKLFELAPDIDITFFEKDSPLKTLLVTGNGRCNLTYGEFDPIEFSKYYTRGEKFLYSVFSRYSVSDTLRDFEKIGVETYMQNDFRIFPKSDKASLVRKSMLDKIKKAKIIKKRVFIPPVGYDAIILACGLKSGGDLIKKFSHTLIPLRPALCGLKIKEKQFLTLKGVSFNGVIFTDCGVSGPFIYKLSSINAYKDFPYEIDIPLIDTEKLKAKVKENPKKLFKNVAADFIPKSLANILINSDKNCANTTNLEIEALKTLKLTAVSTDNRGEIVHAGGVCLKETDKNFKSKIVPNLWIIGEALDIDGLTGGFNLQLCWSSAAIAALDIVNKLYS